MEKRRIELRLKWTQVAERADLSQAGLGAIRRGERHPSALTRARIDHALRWVPGSVDRVLDGGEPTPIGSGETDREGLSAQDLRIMIAESQDELRYLSPKYESNRASLTAHLERRIAELQRQLDALNGGS